MRESELIARALPKVGWGLDELPEKYGATAYWRWECLFPHEKDAVRRQIIVELGGECAVCGSTKKLAVHHRDMEGSFCRGVLGETPLRLSKILNPEYHVLLCNKCHPKYEKRSNALDQWISILREVTPPEYHGFAGVMSDIYR